MELELWDVYNKNLEKIEGKTAVRGEPLNNGEYHLVISAWIRNSKGEFLVSRRSEIKPHAGMIETVTGSAIKGEDSITSILREIKEEVGLDFQPEELTRIGRTVHEDHCSFVADIWLAERDVDLSEIVNNEEVSETFWLSRNEVRDLVMSDNFFNAYVHKYLFEEGIL